MPRCFEETSEDILIFGTPSAFGQKRSSDIYNTFGNSLTSSLTISYWAR